MTATTGDHNALIIPRMAHTLAVDKSEASLSVYNQKPQRFLTRLHAKPGPPATRIFCAGFELGKWRCAQFAFHLAEWLPEYALPEEELRIDHSNILIKLNQAAIRVYTSEKYKSRGEAGEIALHAVCRDFFNTIPISPCVFYKSATNDVVKAFDMVHVRFPSDGTTQIWLGESKLFKSASAGISDAIRSIKLHIDGGFLSNQKILLGPQIPKTTPRYSDIMKIFRKQESLDTLLSHSVFAVGILADSKAIASATMHSKDFVSNVTEELKYLDDKIKSSGLANNLKIVLIYIPLNTKKTFVDAFDNRLKGLQ